MSRSPRKTARSQDFLVGDDTPTGGGTYAKLAGDPHVYTIASYVKTSIDKTPNDLRDKRLLTFDQDKLTRVDLQPADGETIEFGKNNQNDWQILKPKPHARRRLAGGRADPQAERRQDGCHHLRRRRQESGRRLTLRRPRWPPPPSPMSSGTETLEVRKDKDKNYYAKSSAVDGVYKVPADLGDGLDKKVDDFRNKKLFDFGWTDPNKIEIGKVELSKRAATSG